LLLPTLALPAQAATDGRADARTTPRAIALTVADLTAATGLHFVSTGAVVTNRQVATVERQKLATENSYRLTGYQTSLSSPHSTGVINVTDSIGLYKSVAGAQWGYGVFTSQNKPLKGSKPLALNGIGNQERAYIFKSKHLAIASAYFRRGVYTARIDMVGHGSLGQLMVKLAGILDARMRSG
jgi:hypothetical protein